MDKLKINIIGSIFGTSGYDNHTRGLINALYKVADVKLSTQLFPDWEKQCNDAELDMITKQGHKENDINIIVTTPHNWKLYLGTGINCAYCVWEGSKVPVSYIDEMLNPKINLILVPSEHTKNAIFNTIRCYSNITKENLEDINNLIDNKIKVIPHGVDLSLFKPKEVKKEQFTFACNKGWRGTTWDRGGVQYLLRAYCEEFKKEDKVKLIIKLNPAYINPNDIKKSFESLNLPEDRAPIEIIFENTPTNKLVDFYNKGDVYVCPTRAESFDLGSAEAMACGLPVIATNYGGQIEHMNNDCSLFCFFNLEEVKEDIMYEGIEWANISIENLKIHMRWCYEHQDAIKEMGEKATKFISDFTWDNSAKLIVEAICDLKSDK